MSAPEIDRERSAAWRARHSVAIASEPPPEAEAIAADLPPAAQIAVQLGPPWGMELTPVVADQLELFGLLDEDRAGLSDLGLGVFRTLIRWDSEYARREAAYGEWWDRHYAAATLVKAPGHAAAHAACFLDPDAHEPLLQIAAERSGMVLGHPSDLRIANFLQRHRLVDIHARGDTYYVAATKLGRDAAGMLKLAQRTRVEMFAGARQTAQSAEMNRWFNRATETATRLVGNHLHREEGIRRLITLLWIAGQGATGAPT